MQKRSYIRFFITAVVIFTIATFVFSPVKVKGYAFPNEIISIDTNATIIKRDTIKHVVIDTTSVDSLNNDSLQPQRVLDDIITFSADDSIKLIMGSKSIDLYKNANVKYITTELKSDYMSLDMDKSEIFASGLADSTGKLIGKPNFKDKDQTFDCLNLKYNFKSKKGFVKEIVTQQGEGFIQGKLTKQMSDSVFCMKNGLYTTCDQHDHPHFAIRMSKAKMINKNKVVAGFCYLELEDVPLPIFLPFGFFPITHKGTSGILIPTYGEEKIRGFCLRDGGYYLMLGQYADLAVLGTIYTNGSWGAGLQSTYRKRYKFSGNINFTISKNRYSDKGLPDYYTSRDWSVRWSHSQDSKANPFSTFSASVDLSSAKNNYFESTTINDIANQRKQSSISWSKKWPDSPFSLSMALSHNQNSADSTISMTLPNLNFKMTSIYPFRRKVRVGDLRWYENLALTYSLEMRNNLSTTERYFSNDFTDLQRRWKNGFRHSIPLSTSINIFKDVSFSPSFSYTGVGFMKYINKQWVTDGTHPSGGYVQIDTIYGFKYAHNYTASASISYNPTMYGMIQFSSPYSKIYAIRHVFRPSFSASYTPKVGVKRSKYWKSYSDSNGRDVEYSIFEGQLYTPPTGATESGSLSVSIDNNIEMKVRNYRDTTSKDEFKKIKLLESFRASSSYNFFADSMRWSNISVSARTKVFKDKININLSGTIDPYAINAMGQRYNKYSGGIGRLTSASGSTGISFSSQQGGKKAKKGESSEKSEDDKKETAPATSRFATFNIPWSINIDYSMSYNKTYSANTAPGATKPISKGKITQNMRVNGNFSLTPKWEFSFSSGYDFDNHEITSTSFSIKRDLHCFSMQISCIPFGTHQSYNFQINVNSSILKDMKITKRDSWYDKQ